LVLQEPNPKLSEALLFFRLTSQILNLDKNDVKDTLVEAGMTMDDLVYVQVASTDLSLYDKFNAAYRGYFTAKELPAREFIGVASLLRGGHFEIQAIAVRH
jgi:enamine deaminase RidA (YjgF/YER057c/UK114 family)